MQGTQRPCRLQNSPWPRGSSEETSQNPPSLEEAGVPSFGVDRTHQLRLHLPLVHPEKVPSASPTSGRRLPKEWVVRDGAEAQGERPVPLGRVRDDPCSSPVLPPWLGFRPPRGRRRRDHEGASPGSCLAFSRFEFCPRVELPGRGALLCSVLAGTARAPLQLRRSAFPRAGLGAPTFPRPCPLGISSFCDNRRVHVRWLRAQGSPGSGNPYVSVRASGVCADREMPGSLERLGVV